MSKKKYSEADLDSDMYTSKNDINTDTSANLGVKKDGLSFFQKLCFAIAGMSFQLHFCAIGVFGSIFLLNRAKIPPEKNLYILFVSRAADAITDPIFGYLIDKTKLTRIGKLKPWIIVSAPITAINYSLLWYIPEGFSENQLFVWFLVLQSLYFTVATGARIPHTAMTMYLCSSLKDREAATIMRMAFEMVGILLAIGIQGPLVAFDSVCVNSTTETTGIPITTETTPFEGPSEWEKNKYLYISLILNFFFLVGFFLLVVFVKEDVDLVRASEAKKAELSKNINTFSELKKMFVFPPFVFLCISTICSISVVQMIQNTMQLYFEYGYYKVKYLFNYAIIGLLICSIILVPLWKFLMTKFEKKYLVIAGNIMVVPLLIGVIFFSEDSVLEITIFFVLLFFAANSFTCVFLVPWAMFPNVLDEFLLKHGNKLDALFYTFFAIGVKILISIFAGITQLALSVANFKNNECYQEESVATAVKLLMCVGPFICVAIGSVMIFFYPIDNKRAQENSDKVKQMTKGEKVGEIELQPDSLYYEDNLGYVSENNVRI